MYIHSSAVVDDGAIIGKGTKIWHFSHIFSGAELGENCNIGQNVVVSNGVKIGNGAKVQNNISLYSGLECEEDVFLGPSCVFTNVSNPRSQINRKNIYEKTKIKRGATVGANATILCGITLGQYSFVAAGAVVTKSVPDYALVVGNPARKVNWMSRHGHVMKQMKLGIFICPESKLRYKINSEGKMSCIDILEGEILPKELSLVKKSYREFKLL
ncbi:N-acetyltransferase [Verrucomicrobia bacterium]|nr:N-acetyltransferase [Verrucomicrobiota bacterium]